MKHRHGTRLWTLFAALALCFVVLPTGLASATVGTMQITTDTTLTEDHNGTIEINADNVILDCDGHNVTGIGSGNGIEVFNRSGATVRNCHVSGFEKGIHANNLQNSVLTGNTVTDNTDVGIVVFLSDVNTISDNTLTNNGADGLGVYSSSSFTVTGNTISGHSDFGVKIRLTGGSVFTDNHVSGNGSAGIFTDGIGNTFTGNEVHRNGEFGFDDDAAVGANTYSKDYCTGNGNGGSDPSGLCQEERVGLVNPSSGEWHLYHSATSVMSFYYGNPGDVPFMGDWDCNDEATPGLFRQSDAYAYLRNSNSQGIADNRFFFGNPSDIPLAGDFNGDGCDTLSIYRPSEARFYIMNELGENEGGLGAADYSFLFGNPGDKPVVGDWDGDGIDEIGLHRESTGFFYYRNTLTTGIADGQFFFGDPGDRFVAGDWGVVDGVDTPAMFRPSSSTFYFRHTLTQGIADSQFVWTGAGSNWLPVSGDFTLN